MALLLNVEPVENLTCPLKSHSKQGGGWPNVAEDDRHFSEDAKHPQHTQDKAVVDEIRQLGGKFAIMFMLWMGNVPAAFQTELNPTYKPMDRFQNGLEGKRQGEQADLQKVFPKKFHSEFHGNLIYQHVCVSLSFILVLTYFSFKRA